MVCFPCVHPTIVPCYRRPPAEWAWFTLFLRLSTVAVSTPGTPCWRPLCFGSRLLGGIVLANFSLRGIRKERERERERECATTHDSRIVPKLFRNHVIIIFTERCYTAHFLTIKQDKKLFHVIRGTPWFVRILTHRLLCKPPQREQRLQRELLPLATAVDP